MSRVITGGLVLLSICAICLAVLPFGSEHGDSHITANSTRHIDLPLQVYVNGKRYGRVQVHPSGYISLMESVDRLRVFQHPEGRIVVLKEAAGDGELSPTDAYARTTNDSYSGELVASVVQKRFGAIFVPKRTLVTTWLGPKCKCPSTDKPFHARRSTVQCVVTTDGYRSYALYFADSDCMCEGFVRDTKMPCSNKTGRCSNNQNPATFTEEPMDQAHREISAAVQMNPPATPFSPDGDNSTDFFQLKLGSNLCLSLSTLSGSLIPCSDGDGNVTSMTVYRVHGLPGSQQIELFGSGQCLDREHCHSSTSNLRLSDCDHCGAIHWAIESDGTLTEDEGKNCIYVVSGSSSASVHHSSDSCTKFDRHVLGDRIRLRSIEQGDCLAGSVFQNCSSAPQFMVYGLPGDYQIRDTASGYCLDREHCHSSTSNIRIFDCHHCGAIHWSMSDSMLGEDDMANCVNRGPANSAIMKHCSESNEKMTFEIIPTNYTTTGHFNRIELPLPNIPRPDVAGFMGNMAYVELNGLRLFRDKNDGTARFEVVHSLPVTMEFPFVTTSGVYQIRYWVTEITTIVPHNNALFPGMILGWMNDDRGVVTGIELKYGAVDVTNGEFGDDDGVLIAFVTNDDRGAVQIPVKDELLLRLLRGRNGLEWWRMAPRFHIGTYNQTYYNFVGTSPIYQTTRTAE